MVLSVVLGVVVEMLGTREGSFGLGGEAGEKKPSRGVWDREMLLSSRGDRLASLDEWIIRDSGSGALGVAVRTKLSTT